MQELARARVSVHDAVVSRIASKDARIAVVGLGYVGLPLALAFARGGFQTLGLDADASKIAALREGRSYLADVAEADLRAELDAARLRVDTQSARLRECDCIIVCVPTPLRRTNDPDLSFIENAASTIRRALRPGQLVVFESTTYPGCTDELVLQELHRSGLALDHDFLLAFSPERVDPGNGRFTIRNVPRIVGGCSEASRSAAVALYEQVVDRVHPVSSARVAETVKLLENTFRAVNIGLVNELALMCAHMDIDIWEVVEAAKTKPYGFMPFYPGPGIGGHCIPLDPAYLSWRGRAFNLESRFINVAEQINAAMPAHTVRLAADALNEDGKALKGARILVLGVAYKKNVPDARESPAIEIVQTLRARRAHVAFHDPFIPELDFARLQLHLRREMMYFGSERRRPLHLQYEEAKRERQRRLRDAMRSVPLTEQILQQSDCVIVVTDHDGVDYAKVAQHAALVVDTRNALDARVRASARARVVRL